MAEPSTLQIESQDDNLRFQQMLLLRYPLDHWAKEMAEYIMPHRPRWLIQALQSYDSAYTYSHSFNENIFDSTAVLALRTAMAGFLENATSPANPWVALGVRNPDLAKKINVKAYLDFVNYTLLDTYDQGNFYFETANRFLDMLCLPAGVTLMEPDPKYTIRFNTLSWGTFVMDVDENGDVNTIGREEEFEIRQLVPKFCKMGNDGKYDLSNLTTSTQNLWLNGSRESLNRRIMVRHIIRPNPNFQPDRPGAKYKKFVSRYYEKLENNNTDRVGLYLRQSGFDWFPAIVDRWSKRSQEVYSNDCPGLVVLGDIKQLYKNTEDLNHGIDLELDPPLIGPAAMNNDIIQKGPGGFTEDNSTDPKMGLRPLFQITQDLKWVKERIDDIRAIINRGFYVDMFQALSTLRQRTNVQITTVEADALRSEKMVELGPVIQTIFRSLRHCIDVTYTLLNEKGELPPPPPELAGQELPPEFISPFARAQKVSLLSLYDKLLSVVGAMVKVGITDAPMELDARNILDKITKILNLDADTLKAPEVVAAIKQQAAQAQQAETQQKSIVAATQSAQTASQTPMDGDTLLTRLMSMANAGQMGPQPQEGQAA